MGIRSYNKVISREYFLQKMKVRRTGETPFPSPKLRAGNGDEASGLTKLLSTCQASLFGVKQHWCFLPYVGGFAC